LISGEISHLNPPTAENSTYELDFWGPTLECETRNRTIDRVVLESDVSTGENQTIFLWIPGTWQVPKLISSELRSSNDPDLSLGNTTIIHRVATDVMTFKYYPCLDSSIAKPNNQSQGLINLPGSGIHVLVPIIETTCQPRIMKYSVTISHIGGIQHISYGFKGDEPVPDYSSAFKRFKGNFEQWVHFSDAMTLYSDFASNLNNSHSVHEGRMFNYPKPRQNTDSYTLENGTKVETCTLDSQAPVKDREKSPSEIWPLSVFEQRLPARFEFSDAPKFDPEMAKELLANTTISTLSLNERFDVVTGAESRNFPVYHFHNKLAFFLPYGLALTLAVPIIALGLVALYAQNHGVSAMSGGFLQLLMTTTGRTSIEAVVSKGSATLGGYENVPKELEDMEVRFGEFIEGAGAEDVELKVLETRASGCSGSAEDLEVAQDPEAHTALGPQRAGFGTVEETRLLRRRVAINPTPRSNRDSIRRSSMRTE
jgi:hypothetical protein